MAKCILEQIWKKEEQAVFRGWDFSYLDGRWETEALPWVYETVLKTYLKPDNKLLDMGTGGGELLLSLKHPYINTSVTESYLPNVILCQEKLTPLGVEVKQISTDEHLPFLNDSFDVVINKHESYDLLEVKRILKPNGIFITQQVGGKNNETLSNKLIKGFKPEYADNNLLNRSKELEGHSFELLYQNEYCPYLRFFDVGAVVYFAKVIEWEFPGFSVDDNIEALYKLQKELEQKSYIESEEHRFIMVCKNIK